MVKTPLDTAKKAFQDAGRELDEAVAALMPAQRPELRAAKEAEQKIWLDGLREARFRSLSVECGVAQGKPTTRDVIKLLRLQTKFVKARTAELRADLARQQAS